jgi:hypothetical protein
LIPKERDIHLLKSVREDLFGKDSTDGDRIIAKPFQKFHVKVVVVFVFVGGFALLFVGFLASMILNVGFADHRSVFFIQNEFLNTSGEHERGGSIPLGLGVFFLTLVNSSFLKTPFFLKV